MKNVFLLLAVALCTSCSSTRLIDEWESEETPVYESNKVLVIGLNPDLEVRRVFEESLTQALEKENVIAVRSIDFFENIFQLQQTTEEELNLIESLILDAGFDSILFTRAMGYEEKVTLGQAYKNLSAEFNNYKDYYTNNKDLYNTNTSQSYKIYHTETVVFCICEGKERELLWKANIDIVNPAKSKRAINDYVRLLIKSLKKSEIVIVP